MLEFKDLMDLIKEGSNFGTLPSCFNLFSVLTTSPPLRLWPDSMATFSRVKTSTIVNARKRLPSCS